LITSTKNASPVCLRDGPWQGGLAFAAQLVDKSGDSEPEERATAQLTTIQI